MDIIKQSIEDIILNSNLNNKEKESLLHYYKYLTQTEQEELIESIK